MQGVSASTSPERTRSPSDSTPVAIYAHDLLVAALSFVLAVLLRSGLELSAATIDALLYGTPLFVAIAGVAFYALELHRPVGRYASVVDLIAIVRAASWAVLPFLFVLFMIDGAEDVPRTAPIIQWFILVVLLSASRLACRVLAARERERLAPAGATPDTPVLLCGCGPLASLFVHAARSGAGVRVVGIVDDVGDHHGRSVNDVPVLGHVRDLDLVLAELAVHGVHPRRLIVTRAAADLPADARAAVVAAHARHGLEVQHLPDILGVRAEPVADAAWAGDVPVRVYFRVRRLIDVAASAAALLALAPLLALIAALILLDGGRPVLFRQVRPGRHLRPFTLYKFRTMRPAFGADGTPVADDARITAVGRLLRRTRLDELPQLYNVLLGDMSFLGPRPLLPRDLPDSVAERAAVRPGITGWAQVNGGHQLGAAEKMALDAWYVRHAGPWLDARIVWLTVKMMLFGEKINHHEIKRASTFARSY